MNHKKNLLLVAVLASITLLTACASKGQNEMNDHTGMDMPQKLTIEFSSNPSAVMLGQEVELLEHVSKKGEPVKDASVEMEIWRDGDQQHEKVKAAADQKGNYIVKKTFNQAGLYHATLHTTTSEIHQMPTKDFQVGHSK